MAQIVSERDAKGEGEDGFRFVYRIRRDNGSKVDVEASCSRTAAASVRSDGARAYLADHGQAAALEYAERRRRATHILLRVDGMNGSIRSEWR